MSSEIARSDTVDSPRTDQFYDPFNSQDHEDHEGDREDKERRRDMDDKNDKENKESKDGKEDNEDNASSYHSFDDDNNPFLSPEKAGTSTEPDYSGSADPKIEQLSPDPIDSLGLIPFSPKLSGESIRRLALSPRKQKKTRDMSPSSMPSIPMMSFSQRLAEEMGDFSLDFGTGKGVPVEEDVVVGGSDSGSDAEWNHEDIFEDLEVKGKWQSRQDK